jgi:hypothetical protein
MREAHPQIKGNGFDGLVIGNYREEAQMFIDFINLNIKLPEKEVKGVNFYIENNMLGKFDGTTLRVNEPEFNALSVGKDIVIESEISKIKGKIHSVMFQQDNPLKLDNRISSLKLEIFTKFRETITYEIEIRAIVKI